MFETRVQKIPKVQMEHFQHINIDPNIHIKKYIFWLGTLWQQYFWIIRCLSKSYLFWKSIEPR
jgi:hypothetical protein